MIALRPRCAVCGTRTHWAEDAWHCGSCGSEWDPSHANSYAYPADQPEWETVRATVHGRRVAVYWRLNLVHGCLGSIARRDAQGEPVYTDRTTVSWRALGYSLTDPRPRTNVELGSFPTRAAAERAVLDYWDTLPQKENA